MKSRFFTDTQALDASPPPCDKVCVCLRISREAYEQAVHRAGRMRLTSGEYIDRLILSACDTTGQQPSDTPWQRFPPAPPDH